MNPWHDVQMPDDAIEADPTQHYTLEEAEDIISALVDRVGRVHFQPNPVKTTSRGSFSFVPGGVQCATDIHWKTTLLLLRSTEIIATLLRSLIASLFVCVDSI